MGRLSPLSGHLKRMRFGIGGTTLRVDRSSIMIRCSFVVIHEIEIHENATVFLKIRARDGFAIMIFRMSGVTRG